MHGQKRSEYKARQNDKKVSAVLSQKAQQWNALSRELVSRRRPQEPSSLSNEEERSSWISTLALSEKLLSVNPDPSHLWNRRREILIAINNQSKDDETCSFRNEQILTAKCLERNPKAYGSWFHRKWSIRFFLLNDMTSDKNHNSDTVDKWKSLLGAELNLCADFLKLDERNFHCWNYRRFVVSSLATVILLTQTNNHATNQMDDETNQQIIHGITGSWKHWISNDNNDTFETFSFNLMGPQITETTVSDKSHINDTNKHELLQHFKESTAQSLEALLQTEWDFTREKIEENFSNCSAFHYRSKLLPLILKQKETEHNVDTIKMELVKDELDLVQNAIFTEPDDQTAWWYHRFIISWAYPKNNEENKLIEYEQLLEEESETLHELSETENGQCKWALIGLHLVLDTNYQLLEDRKAKNVEKKETLRNEVNECLKLLIDLDPDRKGRYESLFL